MSDDLIRRSDAIDAIHSYWKGELSKIPTIDSEYGEVLDGDCDFLLTHNKELSTRIKALPSADRPQGWIPCSERLPRARESVLLAVNHKYGDWIGEGCYWETTDNHIIWKGYRWNATYWDDEIIAWMPLPKPLKGADDEL